MSKFCMSCGAEMNDADMVCPSCGASQTETAEPVGADMADSAIMGDNSGESKNKNVMIAVIAAAAAVVLIVVIVLANVIFGASYKDPISNTIKAMETGKGKYLYKNTPSYVYEEMYDDYSKKEIIEELDDTAEYMQEYLEDEYGDDIKIKYEIKKKKEIKKSKLRDLEEEIDDEYDKKVKIRKGYEVKVKLKIKGDDDHDTDTSTFTVYKIKGKWYSSIGV